MADTLRQVRIIDQFIDDKDLSDSGLDVRPFLPQMATKHRDPSITQPAGIVRHALVDDQSAPVPYCGDDGQYHFLYVTYHLETLEWYGGRHSTDNLNDGYLGSGDWPQLWRQIAPTMLATVAIAFFPDVESLKRAEAEWITLGSIAADPLCRNVQEGGHGVTSASLKMRHARPGYSAAVGKIIQAALQDPEVNRRLREGQRRGWVRDREQRIAAMKAAITPELCALRSINSREVNARPEVKVKRSLSLRTTLAAPAKRQRKKETADERWARDGERERHGPKTAERHHRDRAERYGIDPNDVEAVNGAHAAHKAELNRQRGAAFRERHQGDELRAANRDKQARFRARQKAARSTADTT